MVLLAAYSLQLAAVFPLPFAESLLPIAASMPGNR
jgi:hypothetical protein